MPDPYAGYNASPPYQMPDQQTPYGYAGTPTPQAQNAYQQYTPMPNYNQAQPHPIPPIIPPRKSPTGWIIGITATVLVVIIIALFVIIPKLASKPLPSASTPTTENVSTSTVATPPTPVPTTSSSLTPSGNPIDSTAASIVTDAQTASSINQITAAPINLTDTFQTSTDIYVTFKLNNDAFNFNQHNGYVAVKFYANSVALTLPDPLTTPLTINEPAPGGFFKVQYITPTRQGAAEVYWCQLSNCSDEKLAQVVTFTVTS